MKAFQTFGLLNVFLLSVLIHTCAHPPTYKHKREGGDKLRRKKSKFPHFPNAPSGFQSIFEVTQPSPRCRVWVTFEVAESGRMFQIAVGAYLTSFTGDFSKKGKFFFWQAALHGVTRGMDRTLTLRQFSMEELSGHILSVAGLGRAQRAEDSRRSWGCALGGKWVSRAMWWGF